MGESVAGDYGMNRKRRVTSTNIIALAAVCMVLLTSIIGVIANQPTLLTDRRISTQAEPRDQRITNDALLAEGGKHAARTEFKPDELLIKFKKVSTRSVNSLTEEFGATVLRHFPSTDTYQIHLPENLTLTDALNLFRNDAHVEYAEPNYLRKTCSTFPNDPYFSNQWALYNVGQEGGIPGADVNAPAAWDVTVGSNATVVAVIDTGTDYNHPDLAGNTWRNPGEIPGNGLDDDLNGYVDDVYGINVVNTSAPPLDDHGHGTHVTGIIGARGDNGVGVAGVNWNVSIMALKFLDNQGNGYDSDAIECIDYAIMMKTQHGVNVRVLSGSWGSADYDQALYDAIQTAGANNILFVAAAGNQYGNNNDLLPFYPASYNLNNIIAVAATDHDNNLASFSSVGSTSIDVGAPGVNIFSTTPRYHVALNDLGLTTSYGYLSGTSMACPHVSGLAALLLALHPSYSCFQLKTRILSSVDSLSSLRGKVLTGGKINAWNALTTVDASMHVNIIEPIIDFALIKGAQYNISAWVHTVTDPLLNASVQASFLNGEPSIMLRDDGVAPDKFANDGIYTASWTPNTPGSLTIMVSASAIGFAPASESVSGNVKAVPTYLFYETTYQWVELSEDAIGLCLGDENVLTVTSAFPVNFYSDLYSNLTIGSNGNINFEDKYLGHVNAPIPSANSYGVNRLIAVFWDDLNMKTAIDHGTVFCDVVGTSPNRTLVIEWKSVAHFSNTGSVTFEILFYENSSDIVLQYQDVSFENLTYDYGANAAIGIQYKPEWGTQFSYRSPSLHNNYALRLSSTGTHSLQMLASEILQNPAQAAYYIGTGNIYDGAALGFVYGKSAHAQNIIGQWNSSLVNQTAGNPLFSGDIVTFGGKFVNKVMNYYEQNGIAKVWFDQNSTSYMFKSVATGQILYTVTKSTYDPSVKDYFVVQTFKDGSRTVLAQWGISAQGTYASGLCFADLIWPHISDFGDSHYIYSWEDLNSDGIPTTNEMILKTSGN